MDNFEHYKNISYQAALGNKAAVDYLMMIVKIAHLWDDLTDKDKLVDQASIDSIFINLLVDLPRNPFYVANLEQLTSVTENAIRNWLLSNYIEQNKDVNIPLECAFILRSSYADIVCTVASICGGHEHGLEISKHIRSLVHFERFEKYIDNLAIEAVAKKINTQR